MFSTWVYLAVALGIAAAAFVIGQYAPGAGMLFVGAASMLWVAYAVARGRKLGPRR